MKKIKITKGREVLVDDIDYERLSKFSWQFTPDRSKSPNGYARRAYSWKYKERKTQGVYMHREIIDIPNGMFCDHINGNGLDNRRENLRVVTAQENMWNKRDGRKNKTGFVGVFLNTTCKAKNTWVAQMTIKGKQVHLGTYKTPKQASVAYQEAKFLIRRNFLLKK